MRREQTAWVVFGFASTQAGPTFARLSPIPRSSGCCLDLVPAPKPGGKQPITPSRSLREHHAVGLLPTTTPLKTSSLSSGSLRFVALGTHLLPALPTLHLRVSRLTLAEQEDNV